MKTISIEPNYLDILKHKLQRKYGYPQYFFQYFEFQGTIDVNILNKAFVITVNSIEKNNYSIMQQSNGVVIYTDRTSSNSFFTKRVCSGMLMEACIDSLENQFGEIIRKSQNPPFILYYYHDGNERQLLVLWVNHIYGDADSGYFVFKNIVKAYNRLISGLCPVIDPRQYVTDEAILQKWKKSNNVIERVIRKIKSYLFVQYSMNYRKKSIQIDRIYSDDYQHDTVKYRSFSIPKIKRTLRTKDHISTNTIISSLIIKAFYSAKDSSISSGVFFAMPVNIRMELDVSPFPFGNYVTMLSVRIKNPNSNIQKIIKSINRQVKFQKICKFHQKSYELSVVLNGKGMSDGLLDGFCKASSLHHFYISNYGRYDREGENSHGFKDCILIRSGGFNFPLQSHIGLIFTIVPNRDSIELGISSSSKILNSNELDKIIKTIKEQAYILDSLK